jgi:ABC-type branched-subunit amino acid transport system substrate-binding protein
LAAAAVAMLASPAVADGLKLGALMPMTGALQPYGETSLNGVRLAVDEMNAAGGVLGGKVELVVGDTQTAPQSGVDAAKKMVSVSKVSGLVGALSSGVSIPVAKSVSSVNGVPQISGASTSPVITKLDDRDFMFRTVPSDAFQGVALARLVKDKGIDDVAVIYVNNDYGKGLYEAFAGAFEKIGGKVTEAVAYEEKQASYRGELQRAAKGGSEHLVQIAYLGDGIPMLKQALEGGTFAKFIFTDGMKGPEMITSIGAQYLNGSFGTSPEALAGEPASRFKKAYEKAYGELPPKPYIDSAYDATMLLGLAAAKAGTTDGKAIRDALRAVANPPGEEILPGDFAKALAAIKAGKDIDYVGAAGSQNLDADGDVPGTFAHWAVKDGEIVTVEVFEPK